MLVYLLINKIYLGKMLTEQIGVKKESIQKDSKLLKNTEFIESENNSKIDKAYEKSKKRKRIINIIIAFILIFMLLIYFWRF